MLIPVVLGHSATSCLWFSRVDDVTPELGIAPFGSLWFSFSAQILRAEYDEAFSSCDSCGATNIEVLAVAAAAIPQ